MHPSNIRHVAIVGSGTMGHGIGPTFAQAAYAVVLHDLSANKLQAATHGVARNLQEKVDGGT